MLISKHNTNASSVPESGQQVAKKIPAQQSNQGQRGQTQQGSQQAKFLVLIMGLLLALMLSVSAHAEDPDAASQKVVTEEDVVDPFGRQTPRSTVQGFIKALGENNASLAANYLNLTTGENPIEVVRQVKLALDTGGRLNAELQIDNTATGNLADQLPPILEKVGTITAQDQVIDILLVRRTSADGNKYWQISRKTLQSIKSSNIAAKTTIIDKYSLKPLQNKTIGGYGVADIFAVFILALFCVAASYIFVGLLYLFLKNYYPKVRKKPLPVDTKVILPLALVITSIILYEVMVYAGVSVTVREPVNRIKDIVGWFASTWLLLRIVDAVFHRAERQSYKRNQTERVSILSLLHKIIKTLLLILASIFIFGNLGFDLTTGIAALGVGGLALALGAQKMIENLVGSVVVVADQPVRVGDYCKFGDLEGTVIDIGIRSTRLRTLNRTIVTVPNGDFSSMSIENFASRDMFHFLHNIYIKRNVEAAVLEKFLVEMEEFVVDHELTNSEWTQVRIAELRQDSMVIEFRAYLYASGADEFYDKQTQLLIDILKQIETYPVEHALETQRMIIESEGPSSSNSGSNPFTESP
ncbi:mechanosensitive ion channel family protein [Psychrobacter sp. FDAARGOS_221]|uniref:mechanosensitive ion channel family protein n=1 Tax=Psychrobacter sp. FDAARGOS_221 TaxID=1975705 RepID=UPI000BB592C1|nr:mechanosensitive ion channel domain-containing protein [Psychrobacter sp. FDAARGOS_221]PNK60004.1 mechanosensitive ion channel family protein [Psychrobacter sp. FDAARGOS_221]